MDKTEKTVGCIKPQYNFRAAFNPNVAFFVVKALAVLTSAGLVAASDEHKTLEIITACIAICAAIDSVKRVCNQHPKRPVNESHITLDYHVGESHITLD